MKIQEFFLSSFDPLGQTAAFRYSTFISDPGSLGMYVIISALNLQVNPSNYRHSLSVYILRVL